MSVELCTPPLIQVAGKLALTSTYGRFKLGAIIARKNKIISMGTNSRKTHPLQQKYANRPHLEAWLHAEIHALTLARVGDLWGSDAYIARVTADGQMASSRPCEGCYRALADHGVKRIFYCDGGKFYKENMA